MTREEHIQRIIKLNSLHPPGEIPVEPDLIREALKLAPEERLRRMDKAREWMIGKMGLR